MLSISFEGADNSKTIREPCYRQVRSICEFVIQGKFKVMVQCRRRVDSLKKLDGKNFPRSK